MINLRSIWRLIATIVIIGFSDDSFHLRAEAWSNSPPKFLQIMRQEIKIGMQSKYSRHEAKYVSELGKSHFPHYYTALSSDNAPEEWFVAPVESYAKLGEFAKLVQKDERLSKAWDRISESDGKYFRHWVLVDAMHHPELSSTTFLDTAKARHVELTIFRVRAGQEETFVNVGKAYLAAKQRVAPKFNLQTYEVLAGMTGPTYIGLSYLQDYGEYDQRIADEATTFEKATLEEKAVFAKWGDAIINTETHRLSVDPGLSYVPKEVRAQDPAFWQTK